MNIKNTNQKGYSPPIPIILGILIVLGIGAGLYYFLSKQIITQQNSSSSTKVSQSSEPTPKDETVDPDSIGADWKTYTNKLYGYSIKYPLQVVVGENGYLNFKIKDGDYSISILSSTAPGTSLHQLNATTVEQVFVSECPQAMIQMCSESSPGPISNSIQFDALNRHFAGVETIVQNGDVIYNASLGINTPNIPISTEAKQIYNQILATLKFTNTDVSKEDAVNIILGLAEVRDYTSRIKKAIVEYSHGSSDGKKIVIHVYEQLPTHTATFGWYDVDKATKQVAKGVL